MEYLGKRSRHASEQLLTGIMVASQQGSLSVSKSRAISGRHWVAGEDTLLGSALARTLAACGDERIAGVPRLDYSHAGVVADFFASQRPDYVYLVAGPNGGILHNERYPADLMRDNLMTDLQVVDAAHRFGVRRLIYVASSCCYPKAAPSPTPVASLMSGPMEPTSEAYSLAKLAGLKLCDAYRRQHGAAFIGAIATNYFGPGDHFDPEHGHVIPALLRRFDNAKRSGSPSVQIWGTGRPQREFLFVDDVASACRFLMACPTIPTPINIAGGVVLSIAQLARQVAEVVDYPGEIHFDSSRPDGAMFKALDGGPIRELGWQPRYSFTVALQATYAAMQQVTVLPSSSAGRVFHA